MAVWEEERRVSKYAAGLEQLDTGRRISPDPSTWKCDETGVSENLWLNLSTGFIGSGRAVRRARRGARAARRAGGPAVHLRARASGACLAGGTQLLLRRRGQPCMPWRAQPAAVARRGVGAALHTCPAPAP